MDHSHLVYNQAGPSNYAGAYVPNMRPSSQSGPGRGRGHSTQKNAQPYSHHHQQTFYPLNTTPGTYPGPSMPMAGAEGLPGMPASNHYNYVSGPPVRHGAATGSHPPHMYGTHNAYLPQMYPPHGSPLYHPIPPPPQMQSYPTAMSPLPYYPPYPYPAPLNPRVQSDAVGKQADIPPFDLPPGDQNGVRSPPRSPLHSQTPSSSLHNGKQAPLLLSEPAKAASEVAILSSTNVERPLSTGTDLRETSEPDYRFSPVQSPGSSKLQLHQESEPPPKPEWIISETRPDNPAEAFGFIISPKAEPPPRIIRAAMRHSRVRPSASSRPVKKTSTRLSHEPQVNDVTKAEDNTSGSTIVSHDQLSGSVTETESRASTGLDLNVPESPWSTATSVSLTAPKTEVAENVDDETAKPEQTTTDVHPLSPKPVLPEADQVLPRSTGSTTTAKKSWASLFQADGAPSSSKSSLPKSDLVGFSVSAADLIDKPREVPHAVRRKELIQLLNNGPRSNSTLPLIRPRGLTNTGNMCFANAVLQTLVYATPFLRFFAEFEHCGPTADDESETKLIPLVRAVVDFLKEFRISPQTGTKDRSDADEEFENIDSFIPQNIYDAMKEKSRFDNMGGGQQEDAEEFFGFFVDTLEEELLALSKSLSLESKPKQENEAEEEGWLEVGKKNKAVVTRTTKSISSPLTRMFGGKYRSTLKVPGQRDSAVLEDWRSLKLDIERDQVSSVEDALRYLSQPQPVQVTSVTKGGATVDASQQFLIETLPPILVLHLKRFYYDTKLNDVGKLRKQIEFGPELVIPADIITPAQRTPHPMKYKLFSVVYHHGHSAAGGHYTLDVLHPNRNADKDAPAREGWIRIDDELVSDLREKDVFGSERDCAYLLFYRRIAGSYARAGMNS